MIRLPLRITACLVAGLTASAVFADTVRLKARPDAQVRFDASISGPTRISVVGDRIAKILQSSSSFEMVNDESTGDVFLRFAGGQPQAESGYIVTESGHTIAFVMEPKTQVHTQTVLITLVGVTSSAASSAGASRAGKDDVSGFQVNTSGKYTGGGGRAGDLVQFTKRSFAAKIGTRSPARLRRGAHGTYSQNGLRARIVVASAKTNRPPNPHTFYRSKRTLAVWVDERVQGDKVWVIIVEAAR